MKFELYNLYLNGHYVKKATRVTLTDGRVIEFMERLSNKEAHRQALGQLVREEQKTLQVTPQVIPQDKDKDEEYLGRYHTEDEARRMIEEARRQKEHQ